MSKREALGRKLANFKKFISESVPPTSPLQKELSSLTDLPIENFVLYIQVNVAPYENTLDLFVDKLITDPAYRLKKSDFTTDKLKTFKRYLEYFIIATK